MMTLAGRASSFRAIVAALNLSLFNGACSRESKERGNNKYGTAKDVRPHVAQKDHSHDPPPILWKPTRFGGG
eukprot:5209371-Amphidinium_carterae.1